MAEGYEHMMGEPKDLSSHSVRVHGLADLKAAMSSSYPYDERYAKDKMKQQSDESTSISNSIRKE